MTDWPSNATDPPNPSLSTADERGSAGAMTLWGRSTWTNVATTWPAAARALYVPVVVESFFTVTRFAWENGGTVSGNVDVGIYDEGGTRITNIGTTAQAGITAIQTVALGAAVTIAPGLYFLAMALSATAGLVRGDSVTGGAILLRQAGVQQQDLGALPLPATATFTAITGTFVPLLTASSGSVI